MSYGGTYDRDSQEEIAIRESQKVTEIQNRKERLSQENSLVRELCKKTGYNRESFENIEVETKLDIIGERDLIPIHFGRGRLNSDNLALTEAEDIEFPIPYRRDIILPLSPISRHGCYVFADYSKKEISPAFTAVETQGNVKIKIKGKAIYRKIGENYIVKRTEQHLPCNSPEELRHAIYCIEKISNLPVEYVGSFKKRSKEHFLFNLSSGRIFVVSNGVVSTNNWYAGQIEVEYYGRINGYQSKEDTVNKEISYLTEHISKTLRKERKIMPTHETKLEWLVSLNENGNERTFPKEIAGFKLV